MRRWGSAEGLVRGVPEGPRMRRRPGVFHVAALGVLALSLLVVASAGAASYGIAGLKDCVSPINVGDAYSCEFTFSNTVQSSHNTVFITSMTDVVGSTPPSSQTTLINSTTIGPTGNANGWSSSNTVCDPTGCTVTFPGE